MNLLCHLKLLFLILLLPRSTIYIFPSILFFPYPTSFPSSTLSFTSSPPPPSHMSILVHPLTGHLYIGMWFSINLLCHLKLLLFSDSTAPSTFSLPCSFLPYISNFLSFFHPFFYFISISTLSCLSWSIHFLSTTTKWDKYAFFHRKYSSRTRW